jgi:hypothetical protein
MFIWLNLIHPTLIFVNVFYNKIVLQVIKWNKLLSLIYQFSFLIWAIWDFWGLKLFRWPLVASLALGTVPSVRSWQFGPGHCALCTQLTIRPWALCPLYAVNNPALGIVPSVRSWQSGPGHCALCTQLTIRPWALYPLYAVGNPALIYICYVICSLFNDGFQKLRLYIVEWNGDKWIMKLEF